MPDTIRVAVLGAASFAEIAHIPGVNAHPRGEVVALYSRDLGRAQEMAARTGVPEATDDLDALLARDDIHAVTVPSSNDQHYPYTMAALRAGKHVFCEKPMALNQEQAAEMTREVRRRGLVNQIAFIFRYTYCVEAMRRLVAEGAIGRPHYVAIEQQGYSWHRARTATWRIYAAIHGAGHLGELGPHCFDVVNFTCGPVAGPIAELAAIAHTIPRTVEGPDGRPQPVETLDLAACLLRTEGGLQGQIITSRATPSPSPLGGLGTVVVTGDEGAVLANFSRGDRELLRRLSAAGQPGQPGQPGQAGQWEDVPLPPEALDGKPHAVFRMLGSFVDNVLRGRVDTAHDADFEAGFRTQAAIDAVFAAAASRRWEPVATSVP
jgi:predicted dehydrogenase